MDEIKDFANKRILDCDKDIKELILSKT